MARVTRGRETQIGGLGDGAPPGGRGDRRRVRTRHQSRWGAPRVCAWGDSGEVRRSDHLLAPGCGGGRALRWGPTCSQPQRPSGVGSGGLWRRELAQPGPQPTQPWRGELISRLSPRLLPLPLSSPSSLFPSLPPGPAPTRPCQAPCPGGCQAPGGIRRGM